MSAIGQIPHRSEILSVSLAFPCIVTTTAAHGYDTFDFIRLTNLNGLMPAPQNGADQLNGNRYRIIVTGDDSFKIQDAITYQDIDSTNFTPYAQGGNANLVENSFIYYGPPGEN
jgi:hypothetical protein